MIWIAVENKYEYMLSNDVYDAFVLVPLYLGMYYKQDLHIHGPVSKKLYKNVMNYLQKILCDFSDDLSRIDIRTDGFKIADGEQNIIGAGISCGVDSMSTIYDYYVKEGDPDYKINGLFFLNTGWHGDYYNGATEKLFFDRYNLNKLAADELGLPLYLVDTNYHAFMYRIRHDPVGIIGYFANYSCAFGLGRAVKKYYMSNCFSYMQMLEFGKCFKNSDFAEFSEAYSVPLIQTEKVELVIDGCQYDRSEKTQNLSDWDIAQKYLNPCSRKSFDGDQAQARNCSECHKCLLTMLTLDAIGKLDKFSRMFDLEKYKKHAYARKLEIVYHHAKKQPEGNEPDVYGFLTKNGMKLPSVFTVYAHMFLQRVCRKLKRILRKIQGM